MIVIVEDEPTQRREMLRRFTEDLKIESVRDFYCAEDVLEDFPTDTTLIVSDIDLPGINGLRFAEKVKEMNPKITIYLCTGRREFPENHRADAIFRKDHDGDKKLWKAIEEFLEA